MHTVQQLTFVCKLFLRPGGLLTAVQRCTQLFLAAHVALDRGLALSCANGCCAVAVMCCSKACCAVLWFDLMCCAVLPPACLLPAGAEFEARILASEANNVKFNFLQPTDPYHAYYRMRVRREGGGSQQHQQQQQQQQSSSSSQPGDSSTSSCWCSGHSYVCRQQQ
jgi:hypothetical protein